MKNPHRPTFRPATKEDVDKLYPGIGNSFRAYVVEVDGRVLGIGGIYYAGGNVVAFSEYDPELDNHRLAKARGLKIIMELVGDRPCIAMVDGKHPCAPKLLERIGFKHSHGNIYKWVR